MKTFNLQFRDGRAYASEEHRGLGWLWRAAVDGLLYALERVR